MLEFKKVNMVEVQNWDYLVRQVYGKIYSFQQQDGCKERQIVSIIVPVHNPQDYKNDLVSEEVNGDDMGGSFLSWLEKDSSTYPEQFGSFDKELFWNRNFYPHIDMLINDLHSKGHLPKGEYMINIDW